MNGWGRGMTRKVEKIDSQGNVIETYKNETVAAKANYLCVQAVSNRCNGKVKYPFKKMDFSFRFKDLELKNPD